MQRQSAFGAGFVETTSHRETIIRCGEPRECRECSSVSCVVSTSDPSFPPSSGSYRDHAPDCSAWVPGVQTPYIPCAAPKRKRTIITTDVPAPKRRTQQKVCPRCFTMGIARLDKCSTPGMTQYLLRKKSPACLFFFVPVCISCWLLFFCPIFAFRVCFFMFPAPSTDTPLPPVLPTGSAAGGGGGGLSRTGPPGGGCLATARRPQRHVGDCRPPGAAWAGPRRGPPPPSGPGRREPGGGSVPPEAPEAQRPLTPLAVHVFVARAPPPPANFVLCCTLCDFVVLVWGVLEPPPPPRLESLYAIFFLRKRTFP